MITFFANVYNSQADHLDGLFTTCKCTMWNVSASWEYLRAESCISAWGFQADGKPDGPATAQDCLGLFPDLPFASLIWKAKKYGTIAEDNLLGRRVAVVFKKSCRQAKWKRRGV